MNGTAQFVNRPSMDDVNAVRAWLANIGLSKYTDVFLSKGFDSVEFIRELKDKSELEEIGITDAKHQSVLLWHAELERDKHSSSKQGVQNDEFVVVDYDNGTQI